MNIEIKNAIITGTILGKEDHGIFSTVYLYLDYGSSGQGFCGYSLNTPNGEEDTHIGTAWGMEFILRIMDVLEVTSWEKLPGTHCRVKAEHSKVHAIGHILKNKWFDPKVDLSFLLDI
jgi:hypothetical protein